MSSSPIFGFSSISHILVLSALTLQLVGYGLLFSTSTVRRICCSHACWCRGCGSASYASIPPGLSPQLLQCCIIPWGFLLRFWHPVVSFRFTCNRTSRCDSRAGSCADFISVRFHSVSHHSFGWIIGAFVSARLARRAYAITGDGASKRIRPRFVAANWFHQYDTFCRHLCMVVVVRVCAFDLALLV